MTNRTPWDDTENGGLLALYFMMLDSVQAGEDYSKAELIRISRGINNDYTAPLANRSRGSIEFKLMNASACHADLIAETLKLPADMAQAVALPQTMHGHGYRALPNYQATLKAAMADELKRREADINHEASA
jgi:hypothetical protein